MYSNIRNHPWSRSAHNRATEDTQPFTRFAFITRTPQIFECYFVSCDSKHVHHITVKFVEEKQRHVLKRGYITCSKHDINHSFSSTINTTGGRGDLYDHSMRTEKPCFHNEQPPNTMTKVAMYDIHLDLLTVSYESHVCMPLTNSNHCRPTYTFLLGYRFLAW